MNVWQPIETHDGSASEVFVSADDWVAVAWFKDGNWWHVSVSDDGPNAGRAFSVVCYPTHWQPMPRPVGIDAA